MNCIHWVQEKSCQSAAELLIGLTAAGFVVLEEAARPGTKFLGLEKETAGSGTDRLWKSSPGAQEVRPWWGNQRVVLVRYTKRVEGMATCRRENLTDVW